MPPVWLGNMRYEALKSYHGTIFSNLCFIISYQKVSCFLRLWIHTTDALAVLAMWAMCRSHFCVSVLWMIPFVPEKPFLGMNAGGAACIFLFDAFFFVQFEPVLIYLSTIGQIKMLCWLP